MYLGDSQVSYPDNPYSRGYSPYGEDLKSKDYYASSGYGPKPREEQKKLQILISCKNRCGQASQLPGNDGDGSDRIGPGEQW